MHGGDSSDFFVFDGNFGSDSVDGGTGLTDILLFGDAGSAMTVDFGTGTASGAAGSVVFVNMEKAVGSSFNDVLRGGSVDVQLGGGAGNDTLMGGRATTFCTETRSSPRMTEPGRVRISPPVTIPSMAAPATTPSWAGAETTRFKGAAATIYSSSRASRKLRHRHDRWWRRR